MIRTGADVPAGFAVRTDVCVIGSGAGGGVAAAVFAEQGREVLVLEEGAYVPWYRMTQREDQMYPLLFRDGANQSTVDGGVSVLQGRVLGGSTVVNMADVESIPEAVLGHWREQFGVDRYPVSAVREAEAACREVIQANQIQPEQLNRNATLLVEGAAKLGLPTGAFVHNRVGCNGSGYCLAGCAYDAKKSVAVTWIPRAIETGHAVVQTDARVARLEWSGSRVVAAVGSVLRQRDEAPVAPFRVEADHFVLAAGTIHSPLVLMASGIGGRQVGRNLSLQPQPAVAALFEENVVLFRGIPQSAYVATDEATLEGGLGGFRLEAIGVPPGMAASSTAVYGAALHAFMRHYKNAAACLCLIPDHPAGRVAAGRDGRPRIRYTLTGEVEARMKRAVRTAAELYLAAGAQMVLLPFAAAEPVHGPADLEQMDRLRVHTASTPMISAHPQGTCRMGPDPASSVVGLDLRVHGLENLQVLDASVFPTSASTHTMLPVMAFAWLGARELS